MSLPAPVPASRLTWPRRLSIPRTQAVDWSQVSDAQIAAEITRRAIEEPILLYQCGLAPRREAFASTIRGICAPFGGNRGGKTVGVGVPWAVALAEGLLPRLVCPEWCPQYGEGTCGLHACPSVDRGSATIPKCVAGQAIACGEHPPLWFPELRTVLVGGLSLEKWNTAILPAFERWLSRYPDGSPQWTYRKADHTIEHDSGRYLIPFYPYDDPKRWESSDPAGILLDEFPPWLVLRAAKIRAISQNTQIKLCGTPVDVINCPEKAGWINPEIEQKARNPKARVQVFHMDTLTNVFLDPEAAERFKDETDQLLIEGKEQEYEVVRFGIPHMRQDACLFSKQAIDRQAANLMPPKHAWVSAELVAEWEGERSPYFVGETTFPRDCTLMPSQMDVLRRSREGTEQGGVACYSCVDRCAAYVSPPRLATAMRDTKPVLLDHKPGRGENYSIDFWLPPQAGHRYALGGDNAKGLEGGDWNVDDLWDVTTGEQVAQYRGQARYDTHAAILYAMWSRYRPFMVLEENGNGTEILLMLMNQYGVPAEDIFFRLDKQRKLPSGDFVPQAGFWTTRGNKTGGTATIATVYGDVPSPIALYAQGLRTGKLTMRSQRSWMELGTFIQSNGRLAAVKPNHDDTVIAGALAALAIYIVEQNILRRPVLALGAGGMQPIGPAHPPGELPPGCIITPTVQAPKTLTKAEWQARGTGAVRRY